MNAVEILVAVGYAAAGFVTVVLVGRWAEDDGIIQPYAFGVFAALVWPVVLVLVVLLALGATIAAGAEAVAKRWLP